MKQQELYRQNDTKNRAITTSLNDLSFWAKNFYLLLALGLMLLSLSSFETKSETDTSVQQEETAVECIEQNETFLQQQESDIVNTFLDYIPGLREYLFRFKKTDLKKTC